MDRPPPLLVVTDESRPRTPASKILLRHHPQPAAEPTFVSLPSAGLYRPSRRREEAEALKNLRRRLQAAKVANQEPVAPPTPPAAAGASAEALDNRPNLLQKILSNRPMSMVLDVTEIQTAWQDSDFITDCLCWHNVYRQRHGSPPLTISSELCYLAQTWANHLAHTNRFYYRNDKDIGQNLFCRATNAHTADLSGQEVASYWYAVVKQYDFRKEPKRLHTNVNAGHFTQMVWRSSRSCGIGKARSRSGKIVVVAHYAPAGNVCGAYLANVLPPGEDTPRLTQRKTPRFAVTGSTTSDSSRSTNAST